MSAIEAIFLAIIEGLTEFLPVSSTGHIILASSFMKIASDDFTKLFTITIQLGSILSVVLIYWRKFVQSLDLNLKLLVALLPAVILGVLLDSLIDTLLESPVVVAVSLVLGGVVLLKVDNWFSPFSEDHISYPKALIIGFFQCLAMIPGVSRSGATIVGGMSQGLSRTGAAEFSFFLAVPTMLGATAKKSYDYYQAGFNLSSSQIFCLVLGNLVAFLVASFAIKSFIHYLTKYGFKVFGYYRIALGITILTINYWIYPIS